MTPGRSLSVLSHGADRTGKRDSTAAFARAIKAAGCGVVNVPAGVYLISGPVEARHPNQASLIGDGPFKSQIHWRGKPGGDMLRIEGLCYSRFEGFGLFGDGESTVGIKYDGIPGQQHTSRNVFDQVAVVGHWIGVQIGRDAFQADQTTWRECDFLRCREAGVSIEDANAVAHNFSGCNCSYCGVGITALRRGTGGHFNLAGHGFQGNVTDIEVYLSQRGCALSYCWSEGSGRFLVVGDGSTAGTVTATECSVNGTTRDDGEIIKFGCGGGLTIIGGCYQSRKPEPCRIAIGSTNGCVAYIGLYGATFDGDPCRDVPRELAHVHREGMRQAIVSVPGQGPVCGGSPHAG